MENPQNRTGRTTVPEAEAVLGKTFPVLDHGFVRLVDYMGGDSAIVQAARVSYGAGTKKVSEDRGLIRYLMRHRHTTPFEMVELKWHCKMPIYVARQWIRHRTANVNEYSLRYSEPKMEFHIPKQGEIRFQSVTNKQGGREEDVPPEISQKAIDLITSTVEQGIDNYNKMNEQGIAREIARIGLPLNTYTEWYWKNDLHNTLHFLGLRLDPHAQKEIREYAEVMADITKKVAPFAYEAFEDYRLNATSLSALEIQGLKRVMQGDSPESAIEQMTSNKRERSEFLEKMKRLNQENE